MIIDGRKIAAGVIERLKNQGAPDRFLAAFLVGDDNNSESFLKQKGKTAKELGVDFRIVRKDAGIFEDALIKEIKAVGADENCGGIVLQLPLPAGLNRDRIAAAIPPKKDVDALHGNLVPSPAILAVDEIFRHQDIELKTKKAAVVGLGFLVGKPISEWLKGRCAEMHLLDIGSDLKILKNADIVITGTGQAGLIKPEMIKPNALVIDFGYGIRDGKTCGDFDASNAPESVRYTPTPGGTGPILVAKLLENFYRLNEK